MKRVVLLLACALPVAACSSTSSPSSTGVPATPDAGAVDEDAGGEVSGSQCTAARKTHLAPVSKVSTGLVKVVKTEGDVTTLYVDASAGGSGVARINPRTYIKLAGGRVAIDDNAAFDSSEWDLALKRVDIYTNSGDAGPGKGGAVLIKKDFDDVTAADADAAKIAPEKFFDENCVGRKDEAEFIITTFSGWYDYEVGGGPAVRPGVSFIVKGADATRYKVGIVSYSGKPDGTEGQATGTYLLKVAKL